VQADGKVLIGAIQQCERRDALSDCTVNADGSLDTGFNPGSGASDTVNAVAVQADGRC